MPRHRSGDPSPDAQAFQDALQALGLVDADGWLHDAAKALGVTQKAIGKWLVTPTSTDHRDIPQWAWRMVWMWQRHPEALADLLANYKPR